MTIVYEEGLYKVLRHSTKPEAKAAAERFDHWVRHEVF
jgi:prophage antirepressor-like protein